MPDDIDTRLTRLEAGQSDIKATLARLEPLLIRIVEEVGEIKGRMNDAPTARDFGRLEGRLDEISRRLPVPLAYQPPEGKRSA